MNTSSETSVNAEAGYDSQFPRPTPRRIVISILVVIGAIVIVGVSLWGWPGSDEVDQEAVAWQREGVRIETVDTVFGDGREAQGGDRVTVHVRASFENQGAAIFDQSFLDTYEQDRPLTFTVGGRHISPVGLDQGVAGMRVGGTRLITIPPELGFGAEQIGSVPPYSTLYYEVELIDVN
ncbi:MAG: FKBP-type peptidyl-prolyl cis-trans isomerase [Candidatus Paceibacterota bacterium]